MSRQPRLATANEKNIERTPRKRVPPTDEVGALKEQLAVLEEEYAEFRDFVDTLAARLRVPLRHTESLVERLQKSVEDSADTKLVRTLKPISESVRAIGELTDELFAFRRVASGRMFMLQFSLAETVQDLIQEFRRQSDGRLIQWQLGNLPEVVGDPVLISAALGQLISNALKSTRAVDRPTIEIDSSEKGQEWIIRVADNGVGFDPKQAGKLFRIFQKLHPDEEFAGLGLGLANVRRIIRRHGGRIWAQGKPGAGATFFISLPRVAPGLQETSRNPIQ